MILTKGPPPCPLYMAVIKYIPALTLSYTYIV